MIDESNYTAQELLDFAWYLIDKYDPEELDDTIFICMDCSSNTLETGEYYMVHDELWERFVPEVKGMLCFNCLEERVGRTLTGLDFTDAPVNYDLPLRFQGS